MPDRLEAAQADLKRRIVFCTHDDCSDCRAAAAAITELIAAAREAVNPRFFYTVGWGQPLFPGYIEVFAADEGEALYKMGVMFGTAWSLCYTSEAAIDSADRIKRITLW